MECIICRVSNVRRLEPEPGWRERLECRACGAYLIDEHRAQLLRDGGISLSDVERGRLSVLVRTLYETAAPHPAKFGPDAEFELDRLELGKRRRKSGRRPPISLNTPISSCSDLAPVTTMSESSKQPRNHSTEARFHCPHESRRLPLNP